MPKGINPWISKTALGAYYQHNNIRLPELPNIQDVLDQPYEPWLGLSGKWELFVYLSETDYVFMDDPVYMKVVHDTIVLDPAKQ